MKQYSEALNAFTQLISLQEHEADCLIECSKLYEHQLKDSEKALSFAAQALALAEKEMITDRKREARAAILKR